MIAKGKIRGEGGKLALYLMTGEDGEVARVIDARGLDDFGPDPAQAFENMELWAQAKTRCKLPFFHEQIRIAPGERLTDAQWLEAVDRSEKRLGFAGQPRLVSFHINEATGEKHLHAAWFRVDFENERAIDPGMFKNHLKQLSRKLEQQFALRELSNDRRPEHRARAADRNEFEQSRRLKTDVNAIRTAILDCFQQADSGKAFAAALAAQGCMLANGDRRDCFVVIDAAGGHHALNKKLTGLTLAQTRDRLADLDRSQLPGVERAQAMQAERQHARERQAAAHGPYTELQRAQTASHFAAQAGRATGPAAPVWDRDADNAAWAARLADAGQDAAKAASEARQQGEHGRGAEKGRPSAEGRYAPLKAPEPAPEPKPERELGGAAADIRLAWRTARPSELDAALEARGIRLAAVSADEARASAQRAAFAKELGNFAPVWREGEIVAVTGAGAIYRLDERTTGSPRAEIEGRLAGLDRTALLDLAAAKEAARAAGRAAWLERHRPANGMESRLAECAERARIAGAVVQQGADGRTVTGAEALADRMRPEGERQTESRTVQGREAFAARLAQAGIALARVTEADVTALAGLRQEEERARQIAAANGEDRKARYFAADLKAGELAAVTRRGEVYRINPAKIGEAARHIRGDLPGIVEARARQQAERAQKAALWEQRQAERRARQALRSEAIDSKRQADRLIARSESAARGSLATSERWLFKSAKAGTSIAGKMLDGIANGIGGIFDFLAGPAKPPTLEEAQGMQRSAEQQAQELADRAAQATNDQAARWRQFEQDRTQQQSDLSLSQRYGRPQTREANLGREDYGPEHERER